jgi:ABC-2 type transport system permease protein
MSTVLTIAALTVVLFGWLPRLTAADSWAVVALLFVIGYFGELFQFPDWFQNLSPFTHTPGVPVDEFTAIPLMTLGALVAAFTTIELVGFRRRHRLTTTRLDGVVG